MIENVRYKISIQDSIDGFCLERSEEYYENDKLYRRAEVIFSSLSISLVEREFVKVINQVNKNNFKLDTLCLKPYNRYAIFSYSKNILERII